MLSVPHLVIIFLVALVVLGPEKLPEVARVLGKTMADFRRITGDFRYQMENEIREMDRQTRLKQEMTTIAHPAALGTVPADSPTAVVAAPALDPHDDAAESAYQSAIDFTHPVPDPVLPPQDEIMPAAPEAPTTAAHEIASLETPKPTDGQSRPN